MKLSKQILEAIQRGINLAIDDFDDDMDIEVLKTGLIKHSSNTRELIIDKYFVDLGLPSGTLWCSANIGATCGNTAESWYGDYYSWGEVETKPYYDWNTYKYANEYYNKLTKYCNVVDYCDIGIKPDNLTTLLDEDDVAVQTNKLPWNVKIPTKKLFDELFGYTTSEWVKNYQGITGLNGRIFTSIRNRNVLFIPAAGSMSGSNVNYVGFSCRIWSSSIYEIMDCCAYYLYFNLSECYLNTNYRCNGYSVRPVLIK